MPSGSHGGSSGGSHFGGGGSSGGSHFGGSRSSNSYSPRPRYNGHRIYIYNGGNYYVGNNKEGLCNLFIWLGVIFAVFACFAGILTFNCNEKISIIKADYSYYQNMIEYAEANPDYYIVDAYVDDMFYNSDAKKFYITYEIECTTGGTLDGYSYSVYTVEQASALRNTTIKVAVNSAIITSSTDSIPIDYKNMSLNDDGEYKQINNQRVVWTIITILTAVGTIAMFVLYRKVWKKNLLEVPTASSTTPVANPSNSNTSNSVWTCKYCGGKNQANNNKCDHCGASKN